MWVRPAIDNSPATALCLVVNIIPPSAHKAPSLCTSSDKQKEEKRKAPLLIHAVTPTYFNILHQKHCIPAFPLESLPRKTLLLKTTNILCSNPLHLHLSALKGGHVQTGHFEVLKLMLSHLLTILAIYFGHKHIKTK